MSTEFILGVGYANSSGFPGVDFKDDHGHSCHVQMSSVCHGYPPGQSALWIGRNSQPMHLNRDQVAALVVELDSWLEHGIFQHQKEDEK
jgi:hypothetical protein